MKNTLRVQRAIREITQAELAKEVKLSVWTINNMEGNKYSPSVKHAIRIARFFGRPVEEIFIWEEKDSLDEDEKPPIKK